MNAFLKKSGLSLKKLKQPDSFDLLISAALSGITLAYEKDEICSVYPLYLNYNFPTFWI
jgi:hypothetical protein